MDQWERYRDDALAADPELRAEYEALRPTYELIADLIRLRLDRGLSQAELAQKMGKQQPAIARLEGGRVKPTIAFLAEVAEALDAKLIVRIEGKDQSERRAS